VVEAEDDSTAKQCPCLLSPSGGTAAPPDKLVEVSLVDHASLLLRWACVIVMKCGNEAELVEKPVKTPRLHG
jgi:hypothetical protein